MKREKANGGGADWEAGGEAGGGLLSRMERILA